MDLANGILALSDNPNPPILMKATTLALALLALARPALASAQEREDRTLLTQAQMTSIINEVSGERAMHHVEELVPWQRVRPR